VAMVAVLADERHHIAQFEFITFGQREPAGNATALDAIEGES